MNIRNIAYLNVGVTMQMFLKNLEPCISHETGDGMRPFEQDFAHHTLPIEVRLVIQTTNSNVNIWEPLQCYEPILATILHDFVFYLFHNEQMKNPTVDAYNIHQNKSL